MNPANDEWEFDVEACIKAMQEHAEWERQWIAEDAQERFREEAA